MSKITNDGLTRSGAGCFIAVPIWQQWALKCKNVEMYRFLRVHSSQLRAFTCHMWSHKFNLSLRERAPPNPSQKDSYSINLPRRDGRVDLIGWLHTAMFTRPQMTCYIIARGSLWCWFDVNRPIFHEDIHKTFLPARRYASAGLCDSNVSVHPSVRLSVCPSVTSRYCVKTKKASVMISYRLVAPRF